MALNDSESKFARITLGNILTMITMAVLVIGLYYKMDARIAAIERVTPVYNLTERVGSVEKKLDDITPQIIRTDANVLWLMGEKRK